jgi:hypothetical protein
MATPIPSLTTLRPSTPSAQLAALRLISDSIAQQRQTQSRALLARPSIFLFLGGALAIAGHALRVDEDIVVVVAAAAAAAPLLLLAGLAMACLLAVRCAGAGFLEGAERVAAAGPAWLSGPHGPDLVLATVCGDQLIGVVVVRQPADLAAKRALVRAWTVSLRYRGQGVGTALLVDAVRAVRAEYGPDVVFEFAPDHANALRCLPSWCNAHFERAEERARGRLRDICNAERQS